MSRILQLQMEIPIEINILAAKYAKDNKKLVTNIILLN